MKLALSLLFIVTCIWSFSQNLDNTEWVQIKMFGKDGSEIPSNQNQTSLKFLFKGDSILRSNNEQYSHRETYVINNNILTIENSTKFKIDSLSDEIMIITDIPNIQNNQEKQNTRLLLNTDYIFDYLRRSKQLNTTADSIIQSDIFLSPTFDGNFNNFFMSRFNFNVQNEELFCSFEILPGDDISNVKIKSNQSASGTELGLIKRIITATQSRWIIPPVPYGYRFNVNFAANISNNANFKGVNIGSQYSFLFHADSLNPRQMNILSLNDVAKEDDTFDYGVRLMKKEKYDKAIGQFQKCLKINPRDTDALYNLAFCYQKTGNTESACELWKELKDMGQRDGERLYNENCAEQPVHN
ncbi:MAG TPA: tetratricopeptide repeat protein [Chitinophagaceae bacterium]|nr:tetratricopeptide repeat protein [Chitinophagaceae bacterium]